MKNNRLKLNDFFVDVQHRALQQIKFSIYDQDEALDILQEAMEKLARKYFDKPDEWPMLFQRILQNLIRDWHRRKKVRSILIWRNHEENSECESIEIPIDCESNSPESIKKKEQIQNNITAAIKKLPLRQQQAFTLRAWWEYDIKETALAMQCSEGSVKTHYSRALAQLRNLLGDIQ